jgi:glycosyltransferase involved in cell wall biosynthesis
MPKPKIVRVVTASYVVPWHLANTLKRITADFDVTVIGQGVSTNRNAYPEVNWVDIDLNRKVSLFSDLRSLWALCQFFRFHKPDAVHSIMPKAGLLCALATFICRVPIRLHTFTGQTWATKKFPARQLLRLLDKTVNTLNTVCLTDSTSQSDFLYANGISHRGKPLPVLGKGSLSGVELSRFMRSSIDASSDSLRVSLGIGAEDFVFAYIARKSRDKGAIDMITAFSRVVDSHPQATLLFVGPDESDGALSSLRTAAPALFRRVIEIDRVENHEAYLAISHVLCVPSYREGFGSIVIDAAAAGVPAIGSRVVGLVDSIEDGETGVLVPAGDTEKFAEAMLSMLNDRERCKQMGLAARRRVELYFTADFAYAALKAFYLEQLATCNPRANVI